MHVELDRLRRELRQKIFVGEPSGETFVAAAPEARIESLRERATKHPEAPRSEAPPRKKDKKGPTTLDDFAA